MKKIFYRSSKGAISVFVLMSMLFFLFATIGIFSIISKRAQTQTESLGDLRTKYYNEGYENQIISNRIANPEILIPVYSSEQLLAIGTPNKTIEIDGEIYDFSQTDYSKYELKNDIIIDKSFASSTILSNENYNSLNRGNYEILYYEKVDNKDYYYQVARESNLGIDNTDYNGFKLAVKYLNQEKIKSTPEKYYGCVVNYQATNSSAADWKIFYADDDNIYLIASDYISANYVPKGKNNSEIVAKATDYCFSMENVIDDYTGGEWIFGSATIEGKVYQNSLAKKWLTQYYNYTADNGTTYPGRTSTNPNIKAVAYMLDTNIWSDFKGNRADYAIGGPTLELLAKSYNAIHSANHRLETNVKDVNGYEIKNSEDANYVDYILNYISESERLYVLPPISETHKANAMWLASPSGAGINDVLYASCAGSINYATYDFNDIGFRPVVRLSSDVILSRNQDGSYNIK